MALIEHVDVIHYTVPHTLYVLKGRYRIYIVFIVSVWMGKHNLNTLGVEAYLKKKKKKKTWENAQINQF